MDTLAARWGRFPIAFITTLTTVAMLGACADEPTGVIKPPTGLAPNAAVGDIIMVTNRSGGTDVGSLRWAMSQATGGETIRFDAALAGRTIVLEANAVLPKFVTIEGDPTYGITVSGAGRYTVIVAVEGVTLRNMNITDGYAFEGAGIMALGPLTLENVSVYNNLGTAGAGGIFFKYDATLINSTVAYNTGPYVAGIGFNYMGGKLTLLNSTVANNTTGKGISAGGPTTIPPVVTFYNSIVAGNGNGSTNGNCGLMPVTFVGNNIVTDASCGTGAGVAITNPRLGIIQNNGGPSLTMQLDRLSPAINAGTSCNVSTDQRYVPRDAKCDIGSYEFTDFNTVTLTIDPNVTVNKTNGYVVVTGTAKCTYADANSTMFSVRLQQRTKEVTTYASFLCSPTAQPWSVALETGAVGISSGTATVTAATRDTPPSYIPASTSRSVKLSAK